MNICVVGWYYFDGFYSELWKANKKYPVTIIAHKHDPMLKICELPVAIVPNVGLEFGAYNYYLMNIWEGGDTLYTHDDIAVIPVIRNYETLHREKIWDDIAETKHDQAYIFQDREDDVFNTGKHGRMIFMSERLQQWFRDRNGFWYDRNNYGYTGEGEKPRGTAEYNTTIIVFHEQLGHTGMDVKNKLYFPSLAMARRGEFKQGGIDQNEQYS
ncbi:MAG: hypothetical protein ACFFCW_26170 [Candidatus Hodarchaeota archaeon]